MALARLTTDPAVVYQLVRLLEDGSLVLQAPGDAPRVFEESGSQERVELRCDHCGRWSTDAGPTGGDRWECFGGTCNRLGQERATGTEGE